MKKIIYTLLCICFFAFAKAQSKDVKAVNAIVEKVNNKLKTIKAAEYTFLHSSPNMTSTYVRKGYFEKLPSDTLAGCKFFVKTELGYSILYDGVNRYNMDTDTLRVVNAIQFSKKSIVKGDSQIPMIFDALLQQFILEYGENSEMIIANQKNNFMKSTVKTKKENNVDYYVITCNRAYQEYDFGPHINKEVVLYVTTDYLPVKLMVTRKIDKATIEDDYFIEKYKLLESMPQGSFLPTVLGNPVKTYIVSDLDKDYYFEEIIRFNSDKD